MRERFEAIYRRSGHATRPAEARLPAVVPVELLRLRKPAGRSVEPATPDLVVGLLSREPIWSRFDLGAGRFSGVWRPGDFVVCPPDTSIEHEQDVPHECLLLVLPASIARAPLAQLPGPSPRDHGPLHGAAQRDAVVESLVRRLWVESAEGDPMGSLFAEDVAVAVAARLARLTLRASGVADGAREDAPPLHGPRLARVLARIEDRLDGDLRQAELAASAGLSPWHFCRAFKAAVGVPPHRFVLLRRLSRAQRLLRTTKLDLTEIAAACGLSSHGHLTRAFKQETGTTPSRWRRAMAG